MIENHCLTHLQYSKVRIVRVSFFFFFNNLNFNNIQADIIVCKCYRLSMKGKYVLQ